MESSEGQPTDASRESTAYRSDRDAESPFVIGSREAAGRVPPNVGGASVTMYIEERVNHLRKTNKSRMEEAKYAPDEAADTENGNGNGNGVHVAADSEEPVLPAEESVFSADE